MSRPHPKIPDPTIKQALEAFLAEQRKRLKLGTMAKYEQVISLLQSHLNGYAHEGLSKAENSFFDKHYEAEGDEHREFCQMFGLDKIIENVGSFFSYFMIRKVMAGADLKRSSGTVVKKLSKWLADKGYVTKESAEEEAEWGSESARDLPKAEKAGEALFRSIKPLSMPPRDPHAVTWPLRRMAECRPPARPPGRLQSSAPIAHWISPANSTREEARTGAVRPNPSTATGKPYGNQGRSRSHHWGH